MRLTKLKLAGFKSFVDPTHVTLPGRLVGVVGPNGCGKSNIMDAVRWVLGESKASELRGESMQDVIFNGSGQRAPVARASVELIFDNTPGRALGQWSQYAELSVKRMLTRNGQSEYFINNLKVRRRDITDLFLGTGLGPRAYAIIGQGMISRIIEARPEELRVFLEEAAGVSRYKERRKETHGRLEDTRENLLRLEDIRQELAQQIERLQGQAETARRYHGLNQALTHKQQLLWLMRRNEAESEARRLQQAIEQGLTDLEGQNAALRQAESALEIARESHFAAGDALHQAQGAMFEVNADVARLEAEIRHRQESRLQAHQRLGQLQAEQQHWQDQARQLESDRGRWEALQTETAMRLDMAEARQAQQQDSLPETEAAHATASTRLAGLRQQLASSEQQLHVEQTHSSHASRNLQAVAQRQERLHQELAALEMPDPLLLALQQEELALAREELAEAEATLAEQAAQLPELESRQKALHQQLQQNHRQLASLEARQDTLRQLQQQAGGESLRHWLQAQGFADTPPLWQQVQVQPGWEVAVEALLRERLLGYASLPAGITPEALPARLAPPARLTLLFGAAEAASSPASGIPPVSAPLAQATPLADFVTGPAAIIRQALTDWLQGVYCADTLEGAVRQRDALPAGACWITPAGHAVSRYGINYFSPEAASADSAGGMLARQRELDALATRIDDLNLLRMQDEERLALLEGSILHCRDALEATRQQLASRRQQVHQQQLALARQEQMAAHAETRQAQLLARQAELAEEHLLEQARQQQANERIADLQDGLFELHENVAEARAELDTVAQQLRDQQRRQQQLDHEVQEARFSLRECDSRLQGIFANQATAARQLQRIAEDIADYDRQLVIHPADSIENDLQQALSLRQEREQALNDCRQALDQAAHVLRQLEGQRTHAEQGLEPLRERISELRLKAQAASLNAEQLTLQLSEAGADEAGLQAELQAELAEVRPQVIQGEITRLQKAIVELGAVNLAALAELETASQRKTFLDAQATDLSDAMQTLENAIRRIDRETRDLLKSTFDAVNRHFGERFPELFGGGRAELVMTGEEILEAGVQVIAQPPGKKNSTIHLLSGGEKALTAIALVFSFFQLNPAPFCLLDEVDAPLDDSNTERFCSMVRKMSVHTQFLFISHNKIAMEMAEQLVGVTMQESGVSRIVDVDIEAALRLSEAA